MNVPSNNSANEHATIERYLRRAFAIAEPHVVNGTVHIAALDSAVLDIELVLTSTKADLLAAKHPECKADRLDWDRFGSIQLIEAYENSLTSANIIRAKISEYLRADRPLPVGLGHFLALLLDRKIHEPKRPKNRPSEHHRDILLKAIAIALNREFKLTVGAQKAALRQRPQLPVRGATIAAAALFGLGCKNITAEQSLNIVSRKKLTAANLLDTGALASPGEPIFLRPRVSEAHADPMRLAFQFLNRKYSL